MTEVSMSASEPPFVKVTVENILLIHIDLDLFLEASINCNL